MECKYFSAESPERAECGWCGKFLINLDPLGRICFRCRSDKDFKSKLFLLRNAQIAPDCKGERTWCDIFNLPTTPENCNVCKSDPEHRQFMFAQNSARKKSEGNARQLPCCQFRSEQIREEERLCCGGRKKTTAIFTCIKNGEVCEADCRLCAVPERNKNG